MAKESDPLDFVANLNSNPAAGSVRMYGDLSGGRAQLHTRRDLHRAGLVQNHLGRSRASIVTANGDTTTISQHGIALLQVGTLAAVAVAATDLYSSQRRVDIRQSLAGTTNVAGLYGATAQHYRGDAAGRGGFYLAFRWGVATGQAATTRGFCGLSSLTSAPTDVDPSTLTDVFGMGWDTADNEIQIMHRNASGTTQKYALSGAVFPVPTADNSKFYFFEIYCPPNGSSINWRIEDPVGGAFDFDGYSSDIPSAATMLAPRIYQSVAGVNSVIGITFMNLYSESDH